MESLTSYELMAICDRFWVPGSGDYAQFVLAYNELANRGPEILDWCRRLLTHPDYWARESGAFLLGKLGHREQLGDAVEAVVAELGALTRRPVDSDGKELQAVDAAIMAFAEIDHPDAIQHLRAVLFSEPLTGDTQWSATEALSQLAGQPFMESPDPVGAALKWLSSQPPPTHGQPNDFCA